MTRIDFEEFFKIVGEVIVFTVAVLSLVAVISVTYALSH